MVGAGANHPGIFLVGVWLGWDELNNCILVQLNEEMSQCTSLEAFIGHGTITSKTRATNSRRDNNLYIFFFLPLKEIIGDFLFKSICCLEMVNHFYKH